MTAPVKQIVLDHLDSERPQPVAVPDTWLVDENWRAGFEYTGGAR